MKTFAFIFARGGSKGVPGKNIRILGGVPLLAHSIEVARQIPQIQDIFVSTEDRRISEIAQEWNSTVIPRPKKLAQDESSEWLAWQQAVEWVEKEKGEFDVFISLPATSPLRNRNDVENCLNKLDEVTDMVVTITGTNRSPWFNIIQLTQEGYVKLLIEGEKHYTRRQDVPQAYNMTTVAYVTRPSFIRQACGIFEGRTKAVEIPEERALDIDTELDFQIADFLFSRDNEKIKTTKEVQFAE